MPIDYIKTKDLLIADPEGLEFEFTTNVKTGEIRPVEVAEYNNLKFIRKGGKIFLRGSLHKYFNAGKHNFNDFHFNNLTSVLDELETGFGIDLHTARIENVETGLNLILPYSPNKVINSLVLHTGQPYLSMTKGKGVECEHKQYYIKVYNKGYQYHTKENILRLEIKVYKMQFLKTHRIPLKTLSDLRNIEVLKAMGELLVRIIEESIWTDHKLTNNPVLTEKQRLLIANGSNPTFWENLKPTENNDPNYSRKRKAYYREIGKFEKLVDKYGNNLKMDIVQKSREKFTDLLEWHRHNTHLKKRDKFTAPITPEPTPTKCQKGTNLHCSYTVNIPTPKVCPITNLNISMQKKNSKFLTPLGVAYYYKNYPSIYKELETRLTDKWKGEPLEIRFREIAHSVRNEFNNPRNNYKRMLTYRGAKLFDDSPYFTNRLKLSMYVQRI